MFQGGRHAGRKPSQGDARARALEPAGLGLGLEKGLGSGNQIEDVRRLQFRLACGCWEKGWVGLWLGIKAERTRCCAGIAGAWVKLG